MALISIDKYLILGEFAGMENLMFEVAKQIGRKLYYMFHSKHSAELSYWQKVYRKEGNRFDNSFYRKLMLGIAQEADDLFLMGKVVADFGCGPRGSLEWIEGAQDLIGIDVLSDKYLQAFPRHYSESKMRYVAGSESSIALPDASVDILFTINALDHVQNLDVMCAELIRILKPGGMLLGSFNLNEPPHKAEPLMLSESLLKDKLFGNLEIVTWRVTAVAKDQYRYKGLLDDILIPPGDAPAILWAKARKVLQG